MPNANKGIVVPSFNSIGVLAIVNLNEAYRRIEMPLAALWAAITGIGDVTFVNRWCYSGCVWRKQFEPVRTGLHAKLTLMPRGDLLAKVPVTGHKLICMYFPLTQPRTTVPLYDTKVPVSMAGNRTRLCDSSARMCHITSLEPLEWLNVEPIHGAEQVRALDAENLLMGIIECSSKAIWRDYEVRETVIGPRTYRPWPVRGGQYRDSGNLYGVCQC